MTGESFDFDAVDRFEVGAVGAPGRREFFLQAIRGSTVVSLKVEKQQVALLADYLDQVLSVQPLPHGPEATAMGLVEPVLTQWTVGSLMVAVNETAGRIVVVAEELVFDDSDDDDDGGDDGATPGADARFALTRNQVEAFVSAARQAVAAGRPPCPLCGRPLDAEGHACPRLN